MISVEPATASYVAKSLLAGRITSVKTSETIMTRLSCGTPPQLAWPYLSSGLEAATAVTDAEALTQRLLSQHVSAKLRLKCTSRRPSR